MGPSPIFFTTFEIHGLYEDNQINNGGKLCATFSIELRGYCLGCPVEEYCTKVLKINCITCKLQLQQTTQDLRINIKDSLLYAQVFCCMAYWDNKVSPGKASPDMYHMQGS